VAVLTSTPLVAQQETQNVAAFAHLYGVARWFYPSDAAAALDWNRFAVEGVRRVRTASTPAMLEATLKELFVPLGPGIEIGTSLPARAQGTQRDTSLIAWHYQGAALTNMPGGAYAATRINRVTPMAAAPAAPAILTQAVAADSLRGKSVRLRARVRVGNPESSGSGGLWLRIDRTGGTMGFFDNMQDRPVRDTAWREYVIEGPIASDATRIVFGALMVGDMTMDVDAVELSVRDNGGPWTTLEIRDASFEAPATGGQTWSQSSPTAFSRVSGGAADGERYLRIASATTAARPETPARATDEFNTPIAGAFATVELTRGLTARVRLSLTDAEARTESAQLTSLRATLANVANPAGRNDVDVRLADAVVAWNVFRHFYPYWADIGVNWNDRLLPHLTTALTTAESREARRDALRLLVADIRDGHGNVNDVAVRANVALLPLQLRVLNNQLVVIASRNDDVRVGSVVKTIDGESAIARLEKEVQHTSGTPQWRQSRAASAMTLCSPNATVSLNIESPDGDARVANVRCEASAARTVEARPDSIAELQPGIWYVDITRIRAAQLGPMLATLSKARGVVFDLRGYPTDAGAAVLPYLMREAEAPTDRWMHIARMTRPFGEVATWMSSSWNVQPVTPHIAGQRVFLTNGGAISYAESVMGYVRDHKLGTIIGSTTAGANGNITNFTVPGGFSIIFTGMRVTRHDGTAPFHMRGVGPDIALEPTLAGIRAGRDELLERAIAILRQ
jgi:C-terminal processing protease CtpA/Prc